MIERNSFLTKREKSEGYPELEDMDSLNLNVRSKIKSGTRERGRVDSLIFSCEYNQREQFSVCSNISQNCSQNASVTQDLCNYPVLNLELSKSTQERRTKNKNLEMYLTVFMQFTSDFRLEW